VSTNKTAKVLTKSGKNGAQASSASRKRTAPIGISQAKELGPAQDKQTKVIDELARLAIELHKDALKELERY